MGNKGYKKENQTNKHNDSFSYEQMEHILFQMKKCICKIKINNKLFGIGFFCKIPFPDQFHLLPVLITSNHTLDNASISTGKKIHFSINNEELSYSILINDSRKLIQILIKI